MQIAILWVIISRSYKFVVPNVLVPTQMFSNKSHKKWYQNQQKIDCLHFNFIRFFYSSVTCDRLLESFTRHPHHGAVRTATGREVLSTWRERPQLMIWWLWQRKEENTSGQASHLDTGNNNNNNNKLNSS